ncbi:MAG: hypothetical protein RSH52_28870 [Janthinobacterium sp.]
MTYFLKARLRTAAWPLTVLGLLSLASCGGVGGESPEQAMTLSQVNLNCTQQPGETCDKVQATVMLYSNVVDQRPLWEEKPAAGGRKVFERVKPIKQPDGSWLMDFTVMPGLAEGTYTGSSGPEGHAVAAARVARRRRLGRQLRQCGPYGFYAGDARYRQIYAPLVMEGCRQPLWQQAQSPRHGEWPGVFQ